MTFYLCRKSCKIIKKSVLAHIARRSERCLISLKQMTHGSFVISIIGYDISLP